MGGGNGVWNSLGGSLATVLGNWAGFGQRPYIIETMHSYTLPM